MLLEELDDRLKTFIEDNFTREETILYTTMLNAVMKLGYSHYDDDLNYYLEIESELDRNRLSDLLRVKLVSDTKKWLKDMFGIYVKEDIPNTTLVDIISGIMTILTLDDIADIVEYLSNFDIDTYDKIIGLLSMYTDYTEEVTLYTYIESVYEHSDKSILDYLLEQQLPNIEDDKITDNKTILLNKFYNIATYIPIADFSIPINKYDMETLEMIANIFVTDIINTQNKELSGHTILYLSIISNTPTDDILNTAIDYIKSQDLTLSVKSDLISIVKDTYNKSLTEE